MQVVLAVLGIGAVPLNACAIEATTEVGGHCDETTVRAICRHTLMDWIIREVGLGTVGVSGSASHAVVAVSQQNQGFFHGLNTLSEIRDASFNHVRFAEVEKVNAS